MEKLTQERITKLLEADQERKESQAQPQHVECGCCKVQELDACRKSKNDQQKSDNTE